jgi:D-alanyl-lipoteichoic acid acyltransferase DltB (MBOAT superfamily)
VAVASWQFLLFAALVAIATRIRPHALWRTAILLLANVAFLATMSSQPSAYIPFALFLAGGYAAILASNRWRSALVLTASIAAVTVSFLWLKKYWFLAPLGFLQYPYLTVGLSYVFFRVLHLVIDAGQNGRPASLGISSYLNYTLNFTCLIAGPIQRYEDFVKSVPPLDMAAAGRAIERVVIGFFKVIVVAAILSYVHGKATESLPAATTALDRLRWAVICVSSYPVYLYFNFSGYVDIVIGVARFIGYELPENFNRPFAALSFMDFWARYHMTLSNWLKDYVYTPFLRVLMTRFPEPSLDPLLGTLAFFVTFFLIGIWHGPTLMFVFYGLLLALGISVNKLYGTAMSQLLGRKRYRGIAAGGLYQACARGLTFTWYAVSMVCFWANAAQAAALLKELWLAGSAACFLGLFLAATVALSAWTSIRHMALSVKWNGAPWVDSRYTRTVFATIMAFMCFLTAVVTEGPAPDIVYKAF